MKRTKKLINWFFALIPGAGQMYNGQMQKGTVLITVFCAVMGVAILFRQAFFLMALPVIWMYSFFDALNARDLTKEEGEEAQAKFFKDFGFVIGDEKIKAVFQGRGGLILGWVLVAFGVYMLGEALYYPVLQRVFNMFPILWNIWYNLPALALSALLFFTGYRLIQKNSTKRVSKKDPEFQAFTPGEKEGE